MANDKKAEITSDKSDNNEGDHDFTGQKPQDSRVSGRLTSRSAVKDVGKKE
ncbi:hypothetical protein JCM19237_4943 [Photobacterium aphoticum]|uniref:Uncharacterized protein n=1 Tax=Photobacterium aphoticum TaxID=754436 RepID=A0A090QRQ8_9GAMM|nr:hypothetical protein JCM19237_4943 [Photobacterium aphoticum]